MANSSGRKPAETMNNATKYLRTKVSVVFGEKHAGVKSVSIFSQSEICFGYVN